MQDLFQSQWGQNSFKAVCAQVCVTSLPCVGTNFHHDLGDDDHDDHDDDGDDGDHDDHDPDGNDDLQGMCNIPGRRRNQLYSQFPSFFSSAALKSFVKSIIYDLYPPFLSEMGL